MTSSDLLSCWFGETEKYVNSTSTKYLKIINHSITRAIDHLFKSAEQSKPSIIFLDEIDSLMRKRTSQEEETTRRIKNEFLTKIDSLNPSTTDNPSVFIIASTNRPWDLDSAFLRRFEKKIYIPLPSKQIRQKLFEQSFQNNSDAHGFTDDSYSMFAEKTEGYSGADIVHIVKDAGMKPIRELQRAQYFVPIHSLSVVEEDSIAHHVNTWAPSHKEDALAMQMNVFEIPQGGTVIPRKLIEVCNHFINSLKQLKFMNRMMCYKVLKIIHQQQIQKMKTNTDYILKYQVNHEI